MKKRLRKKKHHGEYKILGVEILIQLKDKEGYDSFHNSFIKEAIEGNGCYFGGGGREDRIEGFIELGYVSDDPESRHPPGLAPRRGATAVSGQFLHLSP